MIITIITVIERQLDLDFPYDRLTQRRAPARRLTKLSVVCASDLDPSELTQLRLAPMSGIGPSHIVADDGGQPTEDDQLTSTMQQRQRGAAASSYKSTVDIVAGLRVFHVKLAMTRRRPRHVLAPHDDAARRFSCEYRATDAEKEILEVVSIGASCCRRGLCSPTPIADPPVS
jgi:hypothetical protein